MEYRLIAQIQKLKQKNWKGEETNMERADRRKKRRFFILDFQVIIWRFLLQQLIFYRPLWWQSVPDLPYGELSIFWKDTEMITQVQNHRELST